MKPSARPRKKKAPTSEAAVVERLYKTIHQEKRVIQRWVAGAESTLSTSAGGLVVLTTLANSASISTAADFASLAALYTAYRCKAIRVQCIPFQSVPYWNGTAPVYQPAAIAVYPWTSNTVPTTFAQACDVTGVKIVSGYKGCVISTAFKGDPDAHLWTGTGSAISGGEQFGISCIGTSTSAAATVSVWKVIPQYLVEFRMNG